MAGVTLRGDWSKFENQLHKLVYFDFVKLHKAIGETLVSNTQERFARQQAPDGTYWRRSLRPIMNGGGVTLTDTARLKKSIGWRANREGVAVGTNVKYAALQQKGGTITAKRAPYLRFKIGKSKWVRVKQVTIPARPFLGFSKEDVKDIGELTTDAIKKTF